MKKKEKCSNCNQLRTIVFRCNFCNGAEDLCYECADEHRSWCGVRDDWEFLD